MPPGRKSKCECPADLHLKLPNEIRALIDNLGPGDYHSKIIALLLKGNPNKHKVTPFDLQVMAVNIGREIRVMSEEKNEIMEKIKTAYGLSIEDYDRVVSEIHLAIYPEDA